MEQVDLRLGDALTWLAAQPDHSVDAVITDPPYGLGHVYGTAKEEHHLPYTYEKWVRHLYAECRRVVTVNGVVIIRQARIYWRFLAHWFFDADLHVLYKDPVLLAPGLLLQALREFYLPVMPSLPRPKLQSKSDAQLEAEADAEDMTEEELEEATKPQ